MLALPRAARVYIFAILLLGGAIIVVALGSLWENWSLFVSALGLAVVVGVLDLYPVRFPLASYEARSTEVTVSTAVRIAAVLIFPAPVVLLGYPLGTALADWRLKRVWYKLSFNACTMAIISLLMVLVYHFLRETDAPMFASWRNILMLLSLGVTDLVLNSALVSLVIALVVQIPVTQVWAANFRPLIFHDLSMLPLAISITVLYQAAPWSVVLALFPLLAVRSSYQAMIDLRAQTRQALQALAQVLDERDEATSHHCERVAEYAATIARELGLGPEEIEIISRAAWLHDIGKVGMRNDILYKPSGLTAEEREQAKRHAAIGGDLLAKFPLFEKGAIYVRHHHEWWNGQGYPDGRQGEDIPLGARILAVADAFQAMTDARPYRKPMPEQVALGELARASGSQFDPRVVEAFLRVKQFHPPAAQAEAEITSVPAEKASAHA